VIIKIGRTSAPGNNSIKDANPIQRNMNKQNMIPIISNISPINGIVNTAAAYSITSKNTQITSVTSSISVKTKYRGTYFLLFVLLCSPNPTFLENLNVMFNFYLTRTIKPICEGSFTKNL
jgi:hypothetical protein